MHVLSIPLLNTVFPKKKQRRLRFETLDAKSLCTICSISAPHELGIQKLMKSHAHLKPGPMEVYNVRLSFCICSFILATLTMVKFNNLKVMRF
jgi:hypothetical protein